MNKYIRKLTKYVVKIKQNIKNVITKIQYKCDVYNTDLQYEYIQFLK